MKTEILQSILSELQGIRKALEPTLTTGTATGQGGTSSTAAQKPKWPESWDDLTLTQKMIITSSDKFQMFDAFDRLYVLLQVYRDGWKPDWTDEEKKHCIEYLENTPKTLQLFITNRFLAFETLEQAEHFLKHHRELIEQAKELL
jgi:hypothetical protein